MSASRAFFTEHVTPHDSHRHELKRVLVRRKTRFQNAVLADTYAFGRCLILNDEIQSAERDEFIYHECLVQPAMTLHPGAQEVLILGGGEGATAREVLRHPRVKRVTMVDIDGEVVEFCRKYLARWHRGAFGNVRTRLMIGDAKKFVHETRERFDIIMADLPTPLRRRDPVGGLYTLAFYKRLAERLNRGGIFVTQAGSGHILRSGFVKSLARQLKHVFKVVRPYFAFVPSFDEPWSFLIASRQADPLKLSAAQVNHRLGVIARHLRFYDGQAHEGLFRIPKYLR